MLPYFECLNLQVQYKYLNTYSILINCSFHPIVSMPPDHCLDWIWIQRWEPGHERGSLLLSFNLHWQKWKGEDEKVWLKNNSFFGAASVFRPPPSPRWFLLVSQYNLQPCTTEVWRRDSLGYKQLEITRLPKGFLKWEI